MDGFTLGSAWMVLVMLAQHLPPAYARQENKDLQAPK